MSIEFTNHAKDCEQYQSGGCCSCHNGVAAQYKEKIDKIVGFLRLHCKRCDECGGVCNRDNCYIWASIKEAE